MACLTNVSDAVAWAEQQASVSPWMSQCVRLLDFSSLLRSGAFVGPGGTPMTCLNESSWGVRKAICDEYCSYSSMPASSRFSLLDFLQGFSSFVLPWVALAAQLPYESGGLLHDLLSGHLAIGSPILITLSLAITIENKRWATKVFHDLAKKAEELPKDSEDRKAWLKIIMCMSSFVTEAQQEPLGVELIENVKRGSLKDRLGKWSKLGELMQGTKREWTAPLIAQLTVAGISWIFTIVLAFLSEFGSIDAALPTTAGILWTWMIPVVVGWVVVGTQSKDCAANDAFRNAFHLHQEDVAEDEHTIRDQGPPAHGDITLRGPLYNYARAVRWWQFTRLLEQYANTQITSLVTANRRQRLVSGNIDEARVPFGPVNYSADQDTSSAQGSEHGGAPQFRNVQDTSGGVSEPGSGSPAVANQSRLIEERSPSEIPSEGSTSGRTTPTEEVSGIENESRPIDTSPSTEYPSIEEYWRQSGKLNLIWPHLMAWFVQLGTAMPAVIIAYNIPPIGLGCSSGSYLLYMMASTLVYFLLSISAWLSYQVLHNEDQGRDADNRRTPKMICQSYVARNLLWIGKGLAICNCWWLISSTLMELIGAYNTCTCNSSFFGLGASAWIVLFKGEEQLKAQAPKYWTVGLCMAVGVMVFSIVTLVGLA